jgi:hypothetical protein
MIPGVNVSLANGQIGGSVATNDNTTGYVLTGAGTGILPLLTPIKVVSVLDAQTQGITQTAEPEAYKFVTEFYSIPGTLGVPVYIMLAADTTSLVDLCNINIATSIKKLVDYSNGTIRVIAVSRTPQAGYVPTTPKFIDSDVIAAVPNAKAFATAMFAAHTPLRILIAARVNDITSNTIDTPNTLGANNVGLVIGSTANDGFTSMGLFLGRVAATPPHRNLGRVQDGGLPISAYFIGDLPILQDNTMPSAPWYEQLNVLIDSGFMTVTSYASVAGYFISDDPMAVAESDDYASLANGRVIDKASIVSYQTYVQEINNDVDLDANNLLEPVVIAAYDAAIVNALNLNMAESMSGSPVSYTDPSQPILATSTFKTKLRIRPKGYTKIIDVELGFYNPTNN